jgi:SAM-dependent methyltransferase
MTDPLIDLRNCLACPGCYGVLRWSDDSVECTDCKEHYEIVDKVPILLRDASRTSYKQQQAISHDKLELPDEHEFETVRPVHAPAFYGWLMSEKYRRSVIGVKHDITHGIALVSCGGSGMDAHFLASDGLRVISIDISVGAAVRAAHRGSRFGLPILSVVADAEYLPLKDRSVDLAYVHDGLHHLETPETAIAQMARVARYGLSITEPARALGTTIAVKLRAAEAIEESGNHVRRFQLTEIQELLCSLGFEPVNPHRYVMWYRHAPGWLVRLLSRPGLRRAGIAAFFVANNIIGRCGNKLAVQARRLGDSGRT